MQEKEEAKVVETFWTFCFYVSWWVGLKKYIPCPPVGTLNKGMIFPKLPFSLLWKLEVVSEVFSYFPVSSRFHNSCGHCWSTGAPPALTNLMSAVDVVLLWVFLLSSSSIWTYQSAGLTRHADSSMFARLPHSARPGLSDSPHWRRFIRGWHHLWLFLPPTLKLLKHPKLHTHSRTSDCTTSDCTTGVWMCVWKG